MIKDINLLITLMMQTWFAHWMNHGKDRIGAHDVLDKLYNDLKAYIDEYAEISVSMSKKFEANDEIKSEVKNLTRTADELIADLLAAILGYRKVLLEEMSKNDEYSDWRGRLLTTLNHYIFMLGTSERSYRFFANKDQDLIKDLKKYFKNQNEFVTVFNSYIKNKADAILAPDVRNFLSENEGALQDLSNAILETNKKLFDVREDYLNGSQKDIENYNNLVRFFDLFMD